MRRQLGVVTDETGVGPGLGSGKNRKTETGETIKTHSKAAYCLPLQPASEGTTKKEQEYYGDKSNNC